MSAAALPPAAIADARAAVKTFLRMTGGEEEALLATLAGSAMLLAEAFLGDLLIARGCEDALPADGGWRKLAGTPVRAIDSVVALGADGSPIALAPDRYAIEIDADGRGWVRVTGAPPGVGLARASYVAGLAMDWATLPAPIAQGVALLAAHLFDHRDASAAPPMAVSALWRPFRRLRLDTRTETRQVEIGA